MATLARLEALAPPTAAGLAMIRGEDVAMSCRALSSRPGIVAACGGGMARER